MRMHPFRPHRPARRGLTRRLTYSNVMSTIAVFLATATGGAYAANTIGSADVIDGSLTSADIADGTLTSSDIGLNKVFGSRVADGTLTGNDLANNRVTGLDIDESTLGPVPSASSAATAQSAGHATVAGKAAVQDYQVIFRHAPFDQVVRKERTFEAECPAGKRPISGGGHARSTAYDGSGNPPDGYEVAIVESRPSGGYVYGEDDVRPTGWRIKGEATQPEHYNAGISLTVYVVCAKTDMG